MDLYVEESDVDATDVDTVRDEAKGAGGDGLRKRGVKRGTKRGVYRKRNESARQRIVESYKRGEYWKAAATANEVAIKTAYVLRFRCLVPFLPSTVLMLMQHSFPPQ